MKGFYILKDKRVYPADLTDLAEQFEDISHRAVAQEQVGDYFVSTVFLCIDHNFLGSGPPILFETMVFDKNENSVYTERYRSYEEAEEGHKAACNLVKKGQL